MIEKAKKSNLWNNLFPLLIIPSVVVIDQITKQFISTNLNLGESWPENGLLRLTHVTNSGTAFGLFPNQTFLLIIASIIAIGFLAYFYKAHTISSPLLKVALGLQLGGALGNLIDRLRKGEVIDFIDIGIWPNFNVADSSIVIGMTLLVGALFFTREKKQPPYKNEADNTRDKH